MNKFVLFAFAALLSYPFVAVLAQDDDAIQDVILDFESDENPDVVINPIDEAAPAPVKKSPIIPEEVSEDVVVEPNTPLESAVEIIEETAELDEEVDQQPRAVPYSGLYYDADSIGGGRTLQNSSPRQVDPKYEPGSRFVVVEKGAGSGSVQAQLVAAQRALKLERYAAALDLFENLYEKTPNSRSVLMGLAIAQQNNGLTETAIATYEELLELDPGNVEAAVNMLGLMKTRYPAIAYRRLKDLWDNNADNPAIAAQLGLTSAQTGNTSDALRYLGIAASLDPQNASHYYNMAVLADRSGATKDAVQWYQKALELDVTYAGGRSIPRDAVYDRLAYLRRL